MLMCAAGVLVAGKISDRFQTPMWATGFVTLAAVPLCILTDLPPLIDMVGRGHLAVGGG